MIATPAPARLALGAAFAALAALGLLGLFVGQAGAQSDERFVASVEITGAIDNVSANYLSRALGVAADGGADMAVVLLDTPGGLLDSTRRMVEDILGSPVPVAVYVHPPGAQAASAGTFLLAAGNIAAMAPSTNVGAASPVGASGEELPETLASKARQDAAAFLRSIAEERGRNADALEATVLEAKSYTASEAVELGVADLVASSVPDLLEKVDGRVVDVDGAERVLDVEGLPVRNIGRSALERFLGAIANPNIAFLLLSIGGIGILVEFYSPGVFVPGVFGVIALALAFVALGNLPVNWTGLGLMGLALVLFFIELQAPGMSVPGVLGGVAFIIGAFLLFGGFTAQPLDGPDFRVSVWALVGVGVGIAGVLTLLVRASLAARRVTQPPSQLGSAGLVGEEGVAVTALAPEGTVVVVGEEWSAVSAGGGRIERGAQVEVVAVEGLTLFVGRPGGAGDADAVARRPGPGVSIGDESK